MKKNFLFITVCLFTAFLFFLQLNCSSNKETPIYEQIARGKYLADFGGCNDCHTPKMMTQMGPVPDTTRLFSGYPQSMAILPVDTSLVAPGKWILTNDETTIWVGPWGISFSANLTPDLATGLGAWTVNNFISAMRTGKHLGTGRMILPPMPWQGIGQLKDEELKDLFAYLQSVPAVNNRVPSPVPPNMIVTKAAKK